MRKVLIALSALILSILFMSNHSIAKPDNVDGFNVPSGRIPQEIKNNRYPRTYYPNTEKLGKGEMRITVAAYRLNDL